MFDLEVPVQLYHERAEHRSGVLGPNDEEECFTQLGRRTGVWLTTEQLDGPTVISTTVSAAAAGPYDVTSDGGEHRVFVVPAAVCGTWTFS